LAKPFIQTSLRKVYYKKNTLINLHFTFIYKTGATSTATSTSKTGATTTTLGGLY
jgi:hypothetical protein